MDSDAEFASIIEADVSFIETDVSFIETDASFIQTDASFSEATAPCTKKRKKPHITASWTNESIHDLIQSVEIHNCIWEYSCPEYKDRQKRDKAWQTIAKKFSEHGVEGCKAKWANLKTSFLNVKKKIKSKSGQGFESTQPHWPFWKAMQFYCHHDQCKSTVSVSTYEISEETQPPNSTTVKRNNSAVKSSTAPIEERLSPDLIMQRALKFLDTDVDKWHGIGMYLALQMRDLAQKNVKAANKLHADLVSKTMQAVLEEDMQ